MREFSPLTAPFYAFFSRELYVDVAHRWRAGAFVYLLFLVVISLIPFLLDMTSGLSRFMRDEVPGLVEQIPPVTIEGGVVHVDAEQPYFIRDPNSDELYAIIDTTGTFTSLDDTSARLLITRSQVLVKKSDAETRVYDLSPIQHFEVDGPRVERWMALFGSWGMVILIPFIILGVFAYRILQGLFYSLFGLLIAKVLGRRLGYAGILNITLVAIGPAILAKMVVSMLDLTLPVSWLIYFLIAMGYTTFGISSNRDADVAGVG